MKIKLKRDKCMEMKKHKKILKYKNENCIQILLISLIQYSSVQIRLKQHVINLLGVSSMFYTHDTIWKSNFHETSVTLAMISNRFFALTNMRSLKWLKGTSVVVLRVERALYIHSPPTTYNPCRTETRTRNLRITSPTLYH